MLTLSAFLVICTAWWYSQQPGSPAPPPPPGDTTVVVDPVDTTTPPVACTLTGGSGTAGSTTCQPCPYTPPGPGTASTSATCVEPPVNACNLIGGSGNIGDATCQPCGYNPPGAAYATTATECVAPPDPQLCTLHYGTGTVGSSTCQPCPYNPPGQLFATQAPTCVAPVVVDTTPEPTGKIGNATIAALPQSTYRPSYPLFSDTIVLAAGGDLQAAINAATPGTVILLAPGGVWSGNYTLPNKGTSTSFIGIRTNTTILAGRMSPTQAASKSLAKIQSTNSVSPITSTSGHHYWITGVEITNTSGSNSMNALVRFNGADAGITDINQIPHDMVLDRNYIHPLASNNLRRCVMANARRVMIIGNWIDDCHDNNSDSQAIIGWEGSRDQLIENNTLKAGHEIILYGGSDAADSTLQPSDITIRLNHITRPSTWKSVWQVKNLVETKNVRRILIEDNVIENDWSDGQPFAFNFKTENQSGGNTWATTSDVTMRYNKLQNVGALWNLSGIAGSFSGVTAARFYIHDNWLESGWNTSPYTATPIVQQLLNGLIDLIFTHNTVRNYPASTNTLITLDGNPMVNMVWHSNAGYVGTYGVKGTGQSTGTASLNVFAPASIFTSNILVGAGCGSYPAGNICPATWPTTGTLSPTDSLPIGADTNAVKSRTSGVVVAQ